MKKLENWKWTSVVVSTFFVVSLLLPMFQASAQIPVRWAPSEQILSIWGLASQQGYTAYIKDYSWSGSEWTVRETRAPVDGGMYLAAFSGCSAGRHFIRVLCRGQVYYGFVQNNGDLMTVSIGIHLR